jgi:hypothetical protein
MSEILQVPVDLPEELSGEVEREALISERETPISERPVESERVTPQETLPSAPEDIPKAKKMGRPVGKKDAKPRAKPKPRPKAQSVERRTQPVAYESSSSEDEASLQELDTLRLMRAVRAYDQTRDHRKASTYASWFGR